MYPWTYWRRFGIYVKGLAPEASHPAYVAIVPESFYSGTDEFAPFGNDGGHDVLGTLEDWYVAGGRDDDVPRFLIETFLAYQFDVPTDLWSADSEDARAWAEAVPGEVDHIVDAAAQTAIGVAIGQLKIRGHITPAVRRIGWQAITLQRFVLERASRMYPAWAHRDDAAAGVDAVVRVLSRAPSVR